jgi:hypothetical protein
MTTSKTYCRAEYVGNGALLICPYDFFIGAASELRVYVAGVLLTLGVHYTVSGVGSEAGGNVTFVAGSVPAADAAILILRSTVAVQQTDLSAGGTFYEDTIEEMVDKLTRMVQEINERMGRSLTLSPVSTKENLTVPDPAAGQALVWKDDLTGLKNSLFSLSGVLSGNYDWGAAAPDPAVVGDNFTRFNSAFEVGGNMGWVTIDGAAYAWGFISANPV